MPTGEENDKVPKYADDSQQINNLSGFTHADESKSTNIAVDEDKIPPAETAAKSRETDNGGVRTLRENIARALPDSALRRKMMLKAEKKKERLDAKFGKKEYTGGDPKLLENKKLIDEKDKRLEGLTNKEISSIINAPGRKRSLMELKTGRTVPSLEGVVGEPDYPDKPVTYLKHRSELPGTQYTQENLGYSGQSPSLDTSFSDKHKIKNPFNK